jgi:hypothetical protein
MRSTFRFIFPPLAIIHREDFTVQSQQRDEGFVFLGIVLALHEHILSPGDIYHKKNSERTDISGAAVFRRRRSGEYLCFIGQNKTLAVQMGITPYF